MTSKMKNIVLTSAISLISFVINFLIFTYSYNKLATPYLNEEQRVENADFIMSNTLLLFVTSAVIIGIMFYLFIKNKASQNKL